MGDGQDQASGAPLGSRLKGDAFSPEPLLEIGQRQTRTSRQGPFQPGAVIYAPRVSVLMALVWIAAGALAVGLFVLRSRPWDGRARLVPWILGGGIFLVSSAWMALPINAVSTTIDSSVRAHVVSCGDSAWGALHGSSFVVSDAGPEFDPASGACAAAAWHRVAALGSAEVGLAVLIGAAAALGSRRRTPGDSARLIERAAR
jgi:hypothetical protein